MIFLGIDTSNYTTSAAIYDSSDNTMVSKKRLLKVKDGEIGLRQAEAVFQHTLALPEIITEACGSDKVSPDCICVSVSPRDEKGSYMPCFMCGKGTADSMGAAFHVPVRYFSHQAGHISAAVFSSGKTQLLKNEFYAFHVSGGTTEAVLVTPDSEKAFTVKLLASSLDLKAGQAVDRTGNILGLGFPAGAQLDILSRKSEKEYKLHPFMRDGSCSFSGVENKVRAMKEAGEKDEDTAKFCIDYISCALDKMASGLIEKYGKKPMLFSGGVMSNSLIRERFTEKYGAVFAQPCYSSDNAAGISFLGALSQGEVKI